MDSYYWHDYETFGRNPRFDRPSQFAGMRTTPALEPVGEPLVLYCRPPEDMLPEPMACLITGITPQQARDEGVPEPEFIRRVVAELGRPGTCGVGYNSLRFDDEVTRHTLWRNFHDPYAREFRNGCSRWDLIDVARLCHALRPEGIEWPSHEDGRPSFRLEDLARANGLEQARAHDALSDVTATIALARLIRDRQPRLFAWARDQRDKQSARRLLDLDNSTPVLHVSEKFPAQWGCLSLIMPLAAHPVNGNSVICYDLRHDPAALLELDPADLHERLYTPSADLPEGVERIALKTVQVNRCPVLAPLNTLAPEQAERLALDLQQCAAHEARIRAQLPAVAAKCVAVYAMGGFPPGSDPEQDLYGGFLSDADRRVCTQITEMAPEALAAAQPRFRDPRLAEIWFRYRARHFPAALDDSEAARWREHCARRLEFAPDGGYTLEAFAAELAELRSRTAGDPAQAAIVEALAEWGAGLRAAL